MIWAADYAWRYHPKHVQHIADINKLYIVVSCWIIIDTYYAMHRPLNMKFTRYSCHILMQLKLSTDFQEIREYKLSWKSFQWETSCSMQKEGQTDGHEANSRFLQFCESTPKNGVSIYVTHCGDVQSH